VRLRTNCHDFKRQDRKGRRVSRCSKPARAAPASILLYQYLPLEACCHAVALLVQYACMRGIFNLIYSCFFSSLNNLPTYSRTLYLASSHPPGTRTRRSLQRSGRSCQSELWNLMFAGITGKETPLSLDLLFTATSPTRRRVEIRCRQPDTAARTMNMVATLNGRVCMCGIPNGWNIQFHIFQFPGFTREN
jgi:hypothetical protein